MALRLLILISICFAVTGTKVFCKKEIFATKFHTKKFNETIAVDALAIWSPSPGGIFQIHGLCSASTGLPFQRKCNGTEENSKMYSRNSRDIQSVELLDCNKISIIKQCKEELFQNKHNNKWPTTDIGQFANPMNVCLNSTGLPLRRKCIYNNRTHSAEWEKLDTHIECLKDINVNSNAIKKNSKIDLKNAKKKGVKLLHPKKVSTKKQCKEESFEHFYITKNKVTVRSNNKWPTADIGEFAMPINICLNTTGLPLRRKCFYNNKTHSAEWEKLDRKIKCLKDIKEHIVTNDLNELYQKVKKENATATIDSVDVSTRLTNILSRNNTQRIASDLDISTNILGLLTFSDKTALMASRVVGITNLLMQSDERAVLNSRAINTPKHLLRTVETYFDAMTNVFMPNTTDCLHLKDGVKYFIENSTSVFYIYPACSNVSGIAIYSKSSGSAAMRYDKHTNTHFQYLYLNETLDDVIKEPNIVAAVYFPENVWSELSKEYSKKDKKELGFHISLYKNPNFFIGNKNRVPNTVVLRVSIPGYTETLPGHIPYIFNNIEPEKENPVQCGSFIHGFWSLSKLSNINSGNVAVCEMNNLHFGCLIGKKSKTYKINDVLSIIVGFSEDIITIVGCILSLFGLSGIWLTALCCKQWRSKHSNLLLLNICLILTLIMTYFLFINVTEMRQNLLDKFNIDYCIVEGAFLQYSILVLFLWMLIIGILMYRRYATVLNNYYVWPMDCVIYALCAWGLPVIPTLLVWLLDPDSYVPVSESASITNNICYLSGSSFYFGVFIPMLVICTVNISIFFYIIYGFYCRTAKNYRHKKDGRDFILHLRLAILLFFLLGLTWFFGILAYMQENELLSCLFCLTSTLQGFVLFVFCVIIDKTSRQYWVNFFVRKTRK
ncbi:adhesion G-protein coupled receptor G6-like [Musca autumnalis]|uniref:adhesion G-protein coupled receptor G6-like n=1 Tax=Musca autumnalis TaxID=221902 RepID=UPI003CF5E05B